MITTSALQAAQPAPATLITARRLSNSAINNNVAVPPEMFNLKVMRLPSPFLKVTPSVLWRPEPETPSTDGRIADEFFTLSNYLSIPSNPGTVYLGETFRVCMSIVHQTRYELSNVGVKIEIQTSNTKTTLVDSTSASNQTFKVGESKDYLLSHIIQEVGINCLVVTIFYKDFDGSRKPYQKFFKFRVDDPFAIQTKLHQREGLMFVEASITNQTPRALFLEHVVLATSDSGLVVVDMNTRTANQNGLAPSPPPIPVAPALAPSPASLPAHLAHHTGGNTATSMSSSSVASTMALTGPSATTGLPSLAPAGGLFGESKTTGAMAAMASNSLLSLLGDAPSGGRNASPSLFGSSDDRDHHSGAASPLPSTSSSLPTSFPGSPAASSTTTSTSSASSSSSTSVSLPSIASLATKTPEQLATSLIAQLQATSSVFGQVAPLMTNSPRSYLFRVYEMTPAAKLVNDIGRLQLSWRSGLGENGRITSLPILRPAVTRREYDLVVIKAPARVRLEQPFTMTLEVRSQWERRLELRLSLLKDRMTSLLPCGISAKSLGVVEVKGTKQFTVDLLPVGLGVQRVSGLRISWPPHDQPYCQVDFDHLHNLEVIP